LQQTIYALGRIKSCPQKGAAVRFKILAEWSLFNDLVHTSKLDSVSLTRHSSAVLPLNVKRFIWLINWLCRAVVWESIAQGISEVVVVADLLHAHFLSFGLCTKHSRNATQLLLI